MFYIDKHFIHEVTSQAFAGIEKRGLKYYFISNKKEREAFDATLA